MGNQLFKITSVNCDPGDEEWHFINPGDAFKKRLELNYCVYEDYKKIGSIYQNPTKYHINIDMPDKIPPTIQAFIFWLSYRAWAGEHGWRRISIGGRFRA